MKTHRYFPIHIQ